jgi:hypothetical protein
MLLILIPVAWLAITVLIVAVCRIAAAGDGRSAREAEASDGAGIEGLPVGDDTRVPTPALSDMRSTARRRWRAAPGIR